MKRNGSHTRIDPPRVAAGRARLGLVLLVAFGILLAGAGTALALLPRGECIARGVTVLHTDIGGLERARATQALEEIQESILSTQLTFTTAGERHTFTLRELGVTMDIDAILRNAYGIGRTGSFTSRVFTSARARIADLVLTPRFTLDTGIARQALHGIAEDINLPAVNATAHWDDTRKRIVVVPGHSGRRFDEDAALTLVRGKVLSALAAGNTVAKMTLPHEVVAPRVTAEMLVPVNAIIGQFTTSYAGSSRNRAGNIAVAARALHGVVVLPGETFSFNNTVVPRTRKQQYLPAPVIINRQLRPGIGGGVCQVSSTLYNAVRTARMTIVERHSHSLPVAYVPRGRDATVAYDSVDFRFRNATSTPIVIETFTERSRLTVRILGTAHKSP